LDMMLHHIQGSIRKIIMQARIENKLFKSLTK
jgi:hypothetical protein